MESIPDIKFDEVIPSDEQVMALYDFLFRRKHAISHHSLPSLEEHGAFVRSHPYRFWFLIYIGKQAIGSFYISNENTIGINIIDGESLELLSEIIEFVKERYAPLPAIRSVRAGSFTINVPPTNKFLSESLVALGAKAIQTTFKIE